MEKKPESTNKGYKPDQQKQQPGGQKAQQGKDKQSPGQQQQGAKPQNASGPAKGSQRS